MWTITDGIGVCRILEPLAIANGYHVALGGGVLQKGVSDKDLDIFLYLHTNTGKFKDVPVVKVKPEDFATKLTEIGFVHGQDLKNKAASASDENGYKHLIKTEYLGKRIDLIFILP